MDDVSLEVIEGLPLVISTPLDEYYVGEPIPWTANTANTNGTVAVTLLAGERRIADQTRLTATGTLRGTFETAGFKPGLYTLKAQTSTTPSQTPPTAQRQVVVAPDPFGW
jgi:hypothetical protein